MLSSGFSVVGKLAALVLVSAAFLFGMAGVVYMSLKGEEITVPEITGKEFSSSEKELASLGLRIHKKATRFSPEPPNTVIEQLPRPGETVKTGQRIIVVVSKGPGEGEDRRPNIKILEEDDTEKIEEMISDKPKKPKASSNTNRKTADTARDVSVNAPDTAAKSNTAVPSSNKKDPDKASEPADRPPPPAKTPNPAAKPAATPNS
ncbi:hypothetical protein BH20ACI2_BH20ACI2_05310 [soil metagenome]